MLFCHLVTDLSLRFSLSSSDDECDVEKPMKKKEVVDKKEEEDDDEDEEMEKKLTELKTEEIAELKRYVNSTAVLVCAVITRYSQVQKCINMFYVLKCKWEKTSFYFFPP